MRRRYNCILHEGITCRDGKYSINLMEDAESWGLSSGAMLQEIPMWVAKVLRLHKDPTAQLEFHPEHACRSMPCRGKMVVHDANTRPPAVGGFLISSCSRAVAVNVGHYAYHSQWFLSHHCCRNRGLIGKPSIHWTLRLPYRGLRLASHGHRSKGWLISRNHSPQHGESPH